MAEKKEFPKRIKLLKSTVFDGEVYVEGSILDASRNRPDAALLLNQGDAVEYTGTDKLSEPYDSAKYRAAAKKLAPKS